jgi:ribosomal protein S18 acetylase RimI-like enzyme
VEAGRQIIFLAMYGDRMLGAATLSLQTTGTLRRGHVSDLVVSPLWRRRGIASMLLDMCEDTSRHRGLVECTLDVDANNEPAIALYLGRGYRHYRPAYFPWGPGYTLRKPLIEDTARPRRQFWRFWQH